MLTKYEIEEKDLEQKGKKNFKMAKGGIIDIDNDRISISTDRISIIGEPIQWRPVNGTATEIRIEPRFRDYEESYISAEPITYDTILTTLTQLPF